MIPNEAKVFSADHSVVCDLQPETPINEIAARVSATVPKPAVRKDTAKALARPSSTLFAVFLVVAMAGLIVLGRRYWDEQYYTSEEGLGYFMGLAGGIMMLLACLYALMKRLRVVRASGAMRYLLRVHIFFGVTGPVLVLLHSTFHLGSINGAVAMLSMLLVFLSGVVGRYLHSRIYFGLEGQRAESLQLRESLEAMDMPIHSERLQRFEQGALAESLGLFQAFFKLSSFRLRSLFVRRGLYREVRHRIRDNAAQQGWDRKTRRRKIKQAARDLRLYFSTLRKVALLGTYERLFALWHHAHVPLLYLLLLSGIAHVVAVHMY